MADSINSRTLVLNRTRGRYVTLAAALAVPVGLGLSIFGFFGWCVGPAVISIGLVGRILHRKWALWALSIGAGLALGALVYITLGVLTPDGPASGGGSGTVPQ